MFEMFLVIKFNIVCFSQSHRHSHRYVSSVSKINKPMGVCLVISKLPEQFSQLCSVIYILSDSCVCSMTIAVYELCCIQTTSKKYSDTKINCLRFIIQLVLDKKKPEEFEARD